jgi:hypothetical protein
MKREGPGQYGLGPLGETHSSESADFHGQVGRFIWGELNLREGGCGQTAGLELSQ